MQDALLRERYPGGLRSRLAEPLGPGPGAERGGEGSAAAPGDAVADGAARDGARMAAAPTGADAAGKGGPVVVPGALPKPMGITEGRSLRGAEPGRCAGEADARGGLLGTPRPSPAACDAPYDAAALHLARASGGEVPDQALRAARGAAAARNWPAAGAVLGRLPALRPLAVALAWDDLGPGRQGEGDPTGDQADEPAGTAAAGNALKRVPQQGEQGSPDEFGPSRGSADSFRARRELLARLAGPGAAPPPAGPTAVALQRLHAQLRWRLDLAERVGAEDAHIWAEGRAAPAAPAERSRGSPENVSREPKGADAPPRAGAKGVPKGAGATPGAPEPPGSSRVPPLPSGTAQGSALGDAGERSWEGRAAAVLEELAAGRSALRVLRGAPRRPDECGLLAAVAGQPEMVSGKRWLCAMSSPFAIAL